MNVISSILILAAIIFSSSATLFLIIWLFKGSRISVALPGLGLVVELPLIIILFLILSIIFIVAAGITQPRLESLH